MEKPKLYYYLSIAAFVLTFTTGLGIFVSLILLFLIANEKDKLSNKYLVGTEDALITLRKAKKLNIINVLLHIVVIAVILLVVFINLNFMGGRWI